MASCGSGSYAKIWQTGTGEGYRRMQGPFRLLWGIKLEFLLSNPWRAFVTNFMLGTRFQTKQSLVLLYVMGCTISGLLGNRGAPLLYGYRLRADTGNRDKA
jgi:hypothetical protein